MAEEQGKQYGQLIAKAWSDEEFKARLMANPKDAMAEVGMDVPEGLEIEVVESTQEKVYLIIPPKLDGELSDDDLDKVSGGAVTDVDMAALISPPLIAAAEASVKAALSAIAFMRGDRT